MDVQAAVMEFHRLYRVPVGLEPCELSIDRLVLRLKLIKEEWQELLNACGYEVDHHGTLVDSRRQDIVEMADALGDIVYVCFGMAIEMGIDLNRVIAEIQRANLSKLGEDGQPIFRYDGKVLRGPNYSPPNILEVLRSQEPSLTPEALMK